MIPRQEIRKELPHGSLKEVAEKAGVKVQAVSKYFNGKTKSSPAIDRAALEVALKYKKQVQPLLNEMQNMA